MVVSVNPRAIEKYVDQKLEGSSGLNFYALPGGTKKAMVERISKLREDYLVAKNKGGAVLGSFFAKHVEDDTISARSSGDYHDTLTRVLEDLTGIKTERAYLFPENYPIDRVNTDRETGKTEPGMAADQRGQIAKKLQISLTDFQGVLNAIDDSGNGERATENSLVGRNAQAMDDRYLISLGTEGHREELERRKKTAEGMAGLLAAKGQRPKVKKIGLKRKLG